MQAELKEESERLARSWMQHDPERLRSYLISGVEDPRLNVQSILSRHFIIRAVTGDAFVDLMEQEYRFAATMNWAARLLQRHSHPEERELVLHALRKGSDNAEGIEIPHFSVETFKSLPNEVGHATIPNYLEDAFSSRGEGSEAALSQSGVDTFVNLWGTILGGYSRSNSSDPVPRVLEPACGSANDFRFLERYGISRWIDYTGFDLCAKNVENAKALFPTIRFEAGNVFAIESADKAFDIVFVHDLIEHLSAKGIEAAVHEICRVARWGLCIHFFNMDEMTEHIMRPLDEYHWNTLSMPAMKELFQRQGFVSQVLHIGTFLRQRVGCDYTHNPNAYTFLLRPE